MRPSSNARPSPSRRYPVRTVKHKTDHTGVSSTRGIVWERTSRSIRCLTPKPHQPTGSPSTYAIIPGAGASRVCARSAARRAATVDPL